MKIEQNFVDTFTKNSSFRNELRLASDSSKRNMLKKGGYSLDNIRTIQLLFKKALPIPYKGCTGCDVI